METSLVLPGAEPLLLPGNAIGVLVTHGFTGTTQSVRYLAEELHRLGGFTIHAPRLAGHGVTPEAMHETSARDWIGSVDEGLALLRERCSTIFMTGLSMGGCLTLFAAARHADIRGIVPINACVYLDAPALAQLAYDPQAPAFIDGIGSDIKRTGVVELAYSKVPVSSIREIYALMAVTRDVLPLIACPVLVLHSVEDHVVPPSNGDFIIEHVGSADRTLVRLEHSYHVATLDDDRDVVVRQALDFVKRLAPAQD